MKKATLLVLLLSVGSPVWAADSDAEAIYSSLYGEKADSPRPAVAAAAFSAQGDQEQASAEWTAAMQRAWGKTRDLSDLAVVQKAVVREIQEVVKHPVVNGVKRDVPADIDAIIKKYADQYGVSEVLIRALIQVESSFNPKAESPVGAKGLMQLMPVHTVKQGIDPYDPDQNVKTGMAYLSRLLAKYNDLELALAAYNAGEGNVDKYGGIPPFKETQIYVKKIMALLGG
ncbi:lytic transglycosylase domain-containing protein [Escherichia coli]|uniref:lytic transglycosylase domain-containing protein n=1 Tax=Escherichia coli TaxID=562 RepID=UPI000BE88972|nr:lytic transglycosylase domain-containing protein [Escherichia coli]